MTDQEAGFVPTFSHQELPAAEQERALRQPAPKPAPYGSLGAAVAAATAAMTPTFVDASESVALDRLRRLRPVRDQLPTNTLVPTSELRPRVAPKLLQIVDGWGWDGANLLVLGPTRVGKTSGVALLVRLLIDTAARSPVAFSPALRKFWGGCSSTLDLAQLVRWQSCRELSSSAREYPLGQGAPEAIQRCQHARLLVLEDVGAGDDRNTLERILNERYERRWPTITTTGLSSQELVATFGEALVRRMSEHAGKAGLIVNLFKGAPAKAAE